LLDQTSTEHDANFGDVQYQVRKSGRGPTGKLRNFAAMGTPKLLQTALELQQENNDIEALGAIEAELDNRGLVKP